ncbi:MAG: hypothetical protein U5J83_15990 [Bryobacterales bacterium]|nr:hypothetical protein [Bryobacterales bacterium]
MQTRPKQRASTASFVGQSIFFLALLAAYLLGMASIPTPMPNRAQAPLPAEQKISVESSGAAGAPRSSGASVRGVLRQLPVQ